MGISPDHEMTKSTPNALYDRIARLVIAKFESLPRKGKPILRTDGTPEWTTLAGIVLESGNSDDGSGDNVLECVSVATGVKTTPDSKLDKANGRVLHDMHAEILCIRGFNRFLISECEKIEASNVFESKYIRKMVKPRSMTSSSETCKYAPAPGIRVHMFVSEAPCGDCSLANTATVYADRKDEEWKRELELAGPNGPLRGRDHFLHVGYVRTKPGRADAPLSLSKSCSDKLTLKQFTSLLNGSTSQLIQDRLHTASPSSPSPGPGFYLNTLIVPKGELHDEDFQRCFRDRVSSVEDSHKHFFSYTSTSVDFAHSRRTAKGADGKKPKPCPYAIVHVEGVASEGTIMGVRQGFRPFTGRGASCVSRYEMAIRVRQLLGLEGTNRYLEFKQLNEQRRKTKDRVYKVLKNWGATKPDDFEF